MKYIATWNSGYGDIHEVFEAENQEEADNYAYELWRDDAESQAVYLAVEYTKELAEDYGVE